ncbi:MAG: tyrosine-type recombinase/integrase [Pseudomonadota bacterium]
MSLYSVKGKGWRYDFTHKGERYTEAWFKTKTEAKEAEAEKRKELKNPQLEPAAPTDTDFLDLVNKRLDYVKSYNSGSHYRDVVYHAKRWVKEWQDCMCSEITSEMIESYTLKRSKVSAIVANKEIQYLRALFNFGVKRKLVSSNPTAQIAFLPIEKRKRYVPPKDDVMKVVSLADPDAQQYLWAILLTAARVNEINNLTWDDVSFDAHQVTLWTRKRKGGNREPREIPMVPMLRDVLSNRAAKRSPDTNYVFWHRYWSRIQGQWVQGPYGDRNKIMGSLCKSAKVKYFRFHALRHLTASILDDMGIPIGVIQRILGHQNRRTTEIYLHSVGESERRAMSRLQDVDLFTNGFSVDTTAPTNMHGSFWQRKADRPPFGVLQADVDKLGYSGAGRKYGVSDNAVRKWLKYYQNAASQKRRGGRVR